MPRTATMAEEAEHMSGEAREKTEGKPQERKSRVEAAMDLPARMAPPLYIGLTLGSVLLSVGLFARKEKENAIFVGLWAPTLLALGLFLKLVGGGTKKGE